MPTCDGSLFPYGVRAHAERMAPAQGGRLSWHGNCADAEPRGADARQEPVPVRDPCARGTHGAGTGRPPVLARELRGRRIARCRRTTAARLGAGSVRTRTRMAPTHGGRPPYGSARTRKRASCRTESGSRRTESRGRGRKPRWRCRTETGAGAVSRRARGGRPICRRAAGGRWPAVFSGTGHRALAGGRSAVSGQRSAVSGTRQLSRPRRQPASASAPSGDGPKTAPPADEPRTAAPPPPLTGRPHDRARSAPLPVASRRIASATAGRSWSSQSTCRSCAGSSQRSSS